MKYIKFNYIPILCILIIIFLLIIYYLTYDNVFENFESNQIQLIISRYNEDLEWLKKEPYNKYSNIIYNKGENNNFFQNENIIKTINLPNVGREGHTYLYHIIQNYDNLSKINVFLPGSLNIEHKNNKAARLLNELDKSNKNIIIGKNVNNVKNYLHNFSLNEYMSSDEKNREINPESKLELSKIRPFGKWYEDKFNNIDVKYQMFHGIFSVSREEIQQHPKSYYENLISELENSSNPEVGHYFERSWNAVFHPMDKSIFIEGFTPLKI